MSLSKVADHCVFCKSGKSIYTCPRCFQKYCSSYCYKSPGHETCSESFFKEWVEESLQHSDSSDRENMLRILKSFEEESAENIDESSIEERFARFDINEASEDHIWETLNDTEKVNFKEFIRDVKQVSQVVPIKQPWWTVETLNLVAEDSDDETECRDDIAVRPPYPLNTPKLSDLTTTKPSNTIQYSLVSILYAYAFLCRFYNNELRDFLEEVVDFLFLLCPVISEGRNYSSLDESLQDSIRLILEGKFESPLSFVKSIVNDVGRILKGPTNAPTASYVLCALHDVKLTFLELKHLRREQKRKDKDFSKRVLLAVKKIEYFMSWSVQFTDVLSGVATDMMLVMLPDMMPNSTLDLEKRVVTKEDKRPLIEEL